MPNKRRVQTGRVLLNLVILAVLIVGLVAVVRWVIALARTLFAGGALGDVWYALQAFSAAGSAAIWLTAVATVLLWWATRALSRSTGFQLKVDGPFVRVELSVAPPPGSVLTLYPDNLQAEDLNSALLAPHLQGEPRHIYLTVYNAQTKPVGVAAAIEIDVGLFFGGAFPRHPNALRRHIRIEVLGPLNYVTGPILNVGRLPAFAAMVTGLRYRDIHGAVRNSGWGTSLLGEHEGGATYQAAKVFEPRRGEFTSGYFG